MKYRVISIQRGDRKFGWQVMNRGVASNWLTHTHTHIHTLVERSHIWQFLVDRDSNSSDVGWRQIIC